jgi:mono/diheme cytochrome c family protein
MKKRLQLAALSFAALGGMAFTFGGWAIITVDDLPYALTVGQPTTIAFSVRQHGMKLLDHLTPRLTATDEKGGSEVTASALASGAEGHYVAQLVVPRAGNWAITINSSFMNSRAKLLPIAAGVRVKDSEPPVERGRRLFVAKGCVGCHVHGDVPGYSSIAVGPNLTPKRYQADYLAKLLADPSIARTPGKQFAMPNLGLKTQEIASLVAFINADRQVSAR